MSSSEDSGSSNPVEIVVRPWHLFTYASRTDLVSIFFGVIFSIGQGISLPLFAVFFGDAISAASDPSASAVETMAPVIRWFGALSLWMMFCGTLWQACFSISSEHQAARLRVDYLRSVLGKDTAWFDLNNAAAMPAKMVSEVQTVQRAIGPKFGMIIVGISQFATGMGIAYSKSWRLALVVNSGLPCMMIIAPVMFKAFTMQESETHSWYAKAGAVAQEVLGGIRTVAAFGGEDHEAKRYFQYLAAAKWGGVRSGFTLGGTFGCVVGVFSFLYAVGFWYCANYLVGQQINPETGKPYTGGEAIMVFFAVLIGIMAFVDMAPSLSMVASGMASYRSICHAKAARPQIETGRDDAFELPAMVRTLERIEMQRISFRYPARLDRAVLRGLSCTITRGQKAAFVGESGSGKSTVIHLLERFYDPDEGEVLLNGVRLRDLPVAAWRKMVGYVGQEPVLFATSVKENIRIGNPSASEEQIWEAVRQAQASNFLEELPRKLDTYVGLGGGQLSGGQKQRIAIARALVKRPQIIMLDEATSALDNASEREVQATLDSLMQVCAGQLTTISVAHRLSTIKGSDVIFFLHNGVVAEQGTHAELMCIGGHYHALVRSQTSSDNTAIDELDNDEQLVGAVDGTEATGAMQMCTAYSGSSRASPADCHNQLDSQGLYKPALRRLFSMARPEWALMPIAFLGALVSGAVFPVLGFLFVEANGALNVYDEFYRLDVDRMQRETRQLRHFFILAGVASIAAEAVKYGFFAWIQESLTLRLRDLSFRALLRQSVGYFDQPSNGPARLTSMLATQALQVSTLVGISLGNALGTLCAMVVGLAMSFYGCWQLALVVIGVVPIVAAATAMAMSITMSGLADNENKAYAAASEVSAEAVLNIRTVRALGAEEQSTQLYEEMVKDIAARESKRAPKRGFAFGFGNGANMTIYIVGFGVGARFIDDGIVTFENMLRSIMCIMFGIFGAGLALAFAPDAKKGKQAAHDVFQLLETKSAVDAVNPSGTHRSLGDGNIQLKNVRFVYPHRPELKVLRGLTLHVPKGSTVALCGPSGSGKSTVMQLLQRFYDPTGSDGGVYIGGADLRDFDVKWWRKQVGYVGQEPILFDMTIEENVMYGKRDATPVDLESAAKLANMDFLLQGHVKWSDSVGDRGGQLSGGQKQRVAIARALIRDPPVLLLDEATSALDSASEKVVQQALDVAKEGRTTFLIAHRLTTIRDADTIFVLSGGKLIEQGTHEELLANKGVYYDLALASQ